MKKTIYILLAVTATGLTACSNIANKTEPNPMKINMANPASQYCVNQGGELKIKTDAEGGQSGYCYLPNGQVVEEWEFMRSNQPQ